VKKPEMKRILRSSGKDNIEMDLKYCVVRVGWSQLTRERV
jgi:hypothetical protein